MKKTLTININGAVFHIDEDAYSKLNEYLITLGKHFGNTDEGREIVSDIESRIAELFQEKMRGGDDVIAIDWVEEVINKMGTPQDFIEEEEVEDEAPKASTSQNYHHRRPQSRRLYRDPDSRVIAGVCGGIGAYFKFDPTILRIILAVLAIFPSVFLIPSAGAIVLVYIILWVAVPKASTVAQRLEMRGEDINVSNIERTIKEEYEEMKTKFNEFKKSKSYERGRQGMNKAGDALAASGSFLGRLFVILVGVFLLGIGITSLVGISIGLTTSHGIMTNWPWFNDDMGVSIIADHFASGSDLTLIFISVFLITGIPTLMLIFIGTKLIFRYKTNNALIGLSALGLWIISIIMLGVISISQIRNFSTSNTRTKTEVLEVSYATDPIVLKMKEEDYDYDSHLDWNLNGIKLYMNNGEKLLRGETVLDIEKSNSDKIVLNLKTRASGKDMEDAIDNLEDVEYYFSNMENVIIFDRYFSIAKDGKWRNQNLKLGLRLPVGTKIFLDRSMSRLIYDIENINNFEDRDMLGKYWIMTEDGLELYELEN